jgi:hypothetical protein
VVSREPDVTFLAVASVQVAAGLTLTDEPRLEREPLGRLRLEPDAAERLSIALAQKSSSGVGPLTRVPLTRVPSLSKSR